MNVTLILYVLTTPLAIFALDSIKINNVFKVNRVFQARLLYLMVSMSLAYLFANFLYDFVINSQIVKF